jgi:hypothetical protein
LLSGNPVRPALYAESSGFLSSLWVLAVAIVVQMTRQNVARAILLSSKRTSDPLDLVLPMIVAQSHGTLTPLNLLLPTIFLASLFPDQTEGALADRGIGEIKIYHAHDIR